ncbi:MAG: hypothetical protein LBE56_08595 [Tannerella sp.]|jgi:hypothetical protein|nr:hypothetical protein [Tannerella sp.]
MDHIKEKKILLITLPFFNYEKMIQDELEKLGAEVDFYPSKFHKESIRANAFVSPFIVMIYFLLNPFYKRKYTDKVIRYVKAQNKVYDYLFVIQPLTASRRLIIELKRLNPHIKTYIYFWDTFEFFDFSHQIKWFDYAYSFDKTDCSQHKGLRHIHNFYIDNQADNEEVKKYDFSYIGSVYKFSTYKIDIVNRLLEDAKLQQINYFALMKYVDDFSTGLFGINNAFFRMMKTVYLFLFDKPRIGYKKAIEAYLAKGFLSLKGIPLTEATKIQNQSKAIVDISYRNRAGITFNGITAVAYNKKLITTNKYLADESFYRPENILILDEEHPHIDKNFLNTTVKPVDISHLRLDNWLKTIFNAE